MLNSEKKFGLLVTKKINILTLVLSEIFFLNETKNHNPPPLQVKWSVPKQPFSNFLCTGALYFRIYKNQLSFSPLFKLTKHTSIFL